MATTARKPLAKIRKAAASIVWFEIPADNIARAKNFYNSLFGWKFNMFPAAVPEYWHIDTDGHDKTQDGGLMARMHPQQPITNYVSLPSVAKAMTKVEKLGHNTFAPWEMNAAPK